MSSITIDGRATADAELKFSHSGQAILSFSLAENHRKKVGDQWQDDGATFYRVSVFGKRAESLADAVKKGQPVLVTGRFRSREFEGRDGDKRLSLDVVADTVGLIPVGERRQQQSSGSQAADPWASQQQSSFNDEPPF